MSTLKCDRCEGCGEVADCDTGEAWTHWKALPPGSDLAVRMGIVKPIRCPACGGIGRVGVAEVVADAIPLETDRPTLETRACELRPGKVFRHYKGPRYVVLFIAHMHDTRDEHVVYASVDRQTLNLRPVGDFLQDVEWRGVRTARFAAVAP